MEELAVISVKIGSKILRIRIEGSIIARHSEKVCVFRVLWDIHHVGVESNTTKLVIIQFYPISRIAAKHNDKVR